ncbi:hypothetical protein [Flavobacterium phage FL-1]|nr:hypothetical protein [Flavobacterium phage FL-1]
MRSRARKPSEVQIAIKGVYLFLSAVVVLTIILN